jgi:hypothetical protein
MKRTGDKPKRRPAAHPGSNPRLPAHFANRRSQKAQERKSCCLVADEPVKNTFITNEKQNRKAVRSKRQVQRGAAFSAINKRDTASPAVRHKTRLVKAEPHATAVLPPLLPKGPRRAAGVPFAALLSGDRR